MNINIAGCINAFDFIITLHDNNIIKTTNSIITNCYWRARRRNISVCVLFHPQSEIYYDQVAS